MEKQDPHFDIGHNQRQFVYNPYESFIEQQLEMYTLILDRLKKLESAVDWLVEQQIEQRKRHYRLSNRLLSIYHRQLDDLDLQSDAFELLQEQNSDISRLRRSLRNHRYTMNEFVFNSQEDTQDIIKMLENLQKRKLDDSGDQ